MTYPLWISSPTRAARAVCNCFDGSHVLRRTWLGSESIPCIVTTLLYLDAKSFIVFSLVEELKSSSLTIILLLVAFSFVLPKCLSFFFKWQGCHGGPPQHSSGNVVHFEDMFWGYHLTLWGVVLHSIFFRINQIRCTNKLSPDLRG